MGAKTNEPGAAILVAIGTTSAWSPVGTTTLAQRHLANVAQRPKIALGQCIFANHMPTMSTMLEKIRSENTCYLIFWRGTSCPGDEYNISHKNCFQLKCTIYITYFIYYEPTLCQLYNILWQRWHNLAQCGIGNGEPTLAQRSNYVVPTSPIYVVPAVLLTLGQCWANVVVLSGNLY